MGTFMFKATTERIRALAEKHPQRIEELERIFGRYAGNEHVSSPA
jgi:hypothetical protein